MRLRPTLPAPRNRPSFPSPGKWPSLALAGLLALCLIPAALAQSPTTTTLTIAANGSPAIVSQTVVTLTATVVSGATPITHGQVHFCEFIAPNCTDIPALGLAQLTANGSASTKYIPGPGTHTYKAIFAGTNSAQTSTSAASTPVTVSPYELTVIQSGGSPGNYNLSASVTAVGAIFPSGTVTFIDTSNANYVLGTATLTSGQGTFSTGQQLKTAYQSQPLPGGAEYACPVGIGLGDFNADGRLDVMLGDSAVMFLQGLGNAQFLDDPTHVPVAGAPACSIAVGDFNQDGKPDYIMTQNLTPFTGSSSSTPPPPPDFSSTTSSTYVLLNNGNGTYTEPQVISGVGEPFVTVGDLNGDGIPDMVLSAGGSVGLGASIYLGNGDGTFTPVASYTTGGVGQAILGDYNADGKVDLALQNASGQYVLYLGNGDGTFTASALPPPAGLTAPSLTGDFTGNGFADVATSYSLPPHIFPTPPNTSATGAQILQTIPIEKSSFTNGITGIFIVGTGAHLIAAQYNGDSNYLLTVSAAIPLTALPVPTTLALTANPSTFNQFQPAVLTATLAPDFAQNHNATGTVTFTAGATVVGTATIANGVATLTTSKFPAGNNNVIAMYPGDTNFAASTSSPIAVSVAPVDFTLTLASPALTIQTQHHLTTTATLASLNSFADTITLTCPKPPTNITCTFTPSAATLAANGTTTVSLYLDTDSIQGFARNDIPTPSRPLTPIGFALSFFAGVATLRKRRLGSSLLLLLLAALPMTLALTGCGEIIIPPPSVLPGIYTIPVTATATTTGVVHTAQITLTVTR